MRYVMKQKLFSLGDNFVIRDENEQDVYQVKSNFFTIGTELRFMDMAGNELAMLKQKLLSLRPTYYIYRNGSLYAEVHKELFTFLTEKLTIEVPGIAFMEVQGDFFNHEYVFLFNGRQTAMVSKAWFSWVDTYGVDIAEGEDVPLILACTVVIEEVCREHHSSLLDLLE